MKRTLALCSHNRPIEQGTRQALGNLTAAGCAFLEQSGSADVSLARNIALSGALETLARLNKPQRDVVLMVDDDMWFTLEQAQELVDHARKTGVAASAMYATTAGSVAAMRLRPPPTADRYPTVQRWCTGLGLLAIPAALLVELATRSEVFKIYKETYRGFTWSHAEAGEYWSEDFTLCRRLGGVHLLPIAVGHLKTVPLYPDEETIACIREGRRLPGEDGSSRKQLEHIESPRMVERSAARRCTRIGQVLGVKGGVQCDLMADHEGQHSGTWNGEALRWDNADR